MALPRYDGEVMRKLLRFGYPAGVELFLLLAFTSMILLFHGLATATAVTIVFNWDMVSFVPLLGIQIGVVGFGPGALHGCGPAGDRRARDPLRSEDGLVLLVGHLVLFVGFPEQLVAVFQPGGQDPIFSEAAPLAAGVNFGRPLVLADAMMVVFSGALRGAGVPSGPCASRSDCWLLLPVLFITLKILQLSPQTAWLALVILFLSFSGVFYLRYRSGHWKTLTVVGEEADRVAGIRRRGFRIFAAIGTAGPP